MTTDAILDKYLGRMELTAAREAATKKVEAFMQEVVTFSHDQLEFNDNVMDLLRVMKEIMKDFEVRIQKLEAPDKYEVVNTPKKGGGTIH